MRGVSRRHVAFDPPATPDLRRFRWSAEQIEMEVLRVIQGFIGLGDD